MSAKFDSNQILWVSMPKNGDANPLSGDKFTDIPFDKKRYG